ncbi:MAG: hypothetical protein IPJ03_17725 [Ignavibacteriales bacterium]|nr:hypothetical protein [Ignavibacteriales bacterium]MBK7380801.1 hypothetical protein [Ignavibacteriales bacterium]
MIKHSISYNVPFGERLEDEYNNADELRAIKIPDKELTDTEVDKFMQSIKPVLWYQINIASYDYDSVGEDGLPELIFTGHLQEWIYD